MSSSSDKVQPALVLLPGMDGSGDLFKPVRDALGDRFVTQVVRYPNQALGYAALSDFAHKALPSNTPYFILGESFSGPIAMLLAATQPSGLRGLILSSTFMRNPRPMARVLRPMIDWWPMQQLPMTALNQLLLGKHGTKHLRSTLARAIGPVSIGTFKARLKAVLSIDVSAKLREIRVPLLYLLAEDDRLVPPSAAQAMLQIRPEMRVISISAPHMLLQAAPRTAATAISAFVSEVRRHTRASEWNQTNQSAKSA